MKNRQCKICKKEFIPNSNSQKYCCKECSNIAYGKNKFFEKTEICKYCGIVFKTKVSNKKFCSKKCNQRYWGRKNYQKNKEKILYRQKNNKKYQEKQKEYKSSLEYKSKRNKYLRNKRKTDFLWKLKHSIHDRIRLNKDLMIDYSIIDLEKKLNYTIQELWDKLKNNIKIENIEIKYLNGELEMDHIIPYSWYIIEQVGDTEFKKCWNLKNLRLLTKKENRKRKRVFFDWDFIKNNNMYDILPIGPKEIFEKKYL